MGDAPGVNVRSRGEELEHLPAGAVSDTLADRYQVLNEEFLRRARIAWSPTSQEAAQ